MFKFCEGVDGFQRMFQLLDFFVLYRQFFYYVDSILQIVLYNCFILLLFVF